MAELFDSYCGLCCDACRQKAAGLCGGCFERGGKRAVACEVAACARQRGKRFCGECENFPCESLTRRAHDPTDGDQGARIQRCQVIKATLVAEARRGLDPVSVCGHHCDYCFLGQWCGGCRGSYNCCSFATMFADGVCPQVACAQSKGIEGCYQCPALEPCQKGYYGQAGEYIAKASALFIRRHGKARYTEALARAIEAGENYPKSFDHTGSVRGALALLEQYLQPK